ncbi:MAG: hypothetical protein OXR64_10875 [Chloroflexota bacterium]|nr:hypothetical protein [Chloroflexota bacterium]MDE2920334.1 hypothetical protein [Chloroflexota bacterium]
MTRSTLTRRRMLTAILVAGVAGVACGPSPSASTESGGSSDTSDTSGSTTEPTKTPTLDFFRQGGRNPSYPTPTPQAVPGQKSS